MQRCIDIEERSAPDKLGVIRIAGKQCAGRRIGFGDDVHGGFRAQIAQHPFDIAGSGQFAHRVRIVAYA